MTLPRLTIQSVRVRPVLLPLARPIVSKVGRFDEWPLILLDLQTHEGVTGRSYLEPYLKQLARYIVPRGFRGQRRKCDRARPGGMRHRVE